MPLWKSSALALGSLVFVLAIAFGVMIGAGHLIHVLNPAKRFDIFYALHKGFVRWSLLAVCVLWLLPPHPWATRLVEVTGRDSTPERSRGAHVRAGGTITEISRYQAPDPLPRASGRRGVGG